MAHKIHPHKHFLVGRKNRSTPHRLVPRPQGLAWCKESQTKCSRIRARTGSAGRLWRRSAAMLRSNASKQQASGALCVKSLPCVGTGGHRVAVSLQMHLAVDLPARNSATERRPLLTVAASTRVPGSPRHRRAGKRPGRAARAQTSPPSKTRHKPTRKCARKIQAQICPAKGSPAHHRTRRVPRYPTHRSGGPESLY